MLYLFRIISNAEMSAVWYAIHQLDRVFNLLNRPIRVQARRPLLSGRREEQPPHFRWLTLEKPYAARHPGNRGIGFSTP